MPNILSNEPSKTNTNHSKNSVVLITPQEKIIELTSNSLKEWLKSIHNENSKKNDSKLISNKSAEDIARYGFKGPYDLAEFLKTKDGKVLLAQIGAKIALIEAIQQNQQLDEREHKIFMHKLMSMIFLYFIGNKAHAAEYIKDLIEKQNKKTLAAGAKALKDNAKKTTENPYKQELLDAITNYDKAISINNESLKRNLKEKLDLDAMMIHLNDQEQFIDTKYTLFNGVIAAADANIHLIDNGMLAPGLVEKRINELVAAMALQQAKESAFVDSHNDKNPPQPLSKSNNLSKELAALKDILAVHKGEKVFVKQNGVAVNAFNEADLIISKDQKIIEDGGQFYLVNSDQDLDSINNNKQLKEDAANQYQKAKSELFVLKMQLRIQHLSNEIKIQSTEVTRLLKNNLEQEAQLLLVQLTGLNLEIASYHDMLSGKKYVNNLGQTVSPKDAMFVLDKDQQIVEENGKYYLLGPGQNWDLIKQNPLEKENAEKQFELLKPELLTVKNVIKLNQGLEIDFNKKLVTDAENKLLANAEENKLIKNQNSLLQSAKADGIKLLSELELSNTPLKMKATPGASSSVKPSQVSATLFYKQQINELKLRDAKKVTVQDLYNLVRYAPGNRELIKGYLDSKLANLPRTAPIMDQLLLQIMLKNLKVLGVKTNETVTNSIETYKTSVRTNKSPDLIVEEKKNQPSPFQMTPNPYKK